MAVQVQWDNPENTILRYDVQGHWTWDEFLEQFHQGEKMVESVQHRVDAVVNPLDNKSHGYLPPGTLTHVIQLYRNVPSNVGLTVMVSDSEFFRTFSRVGHRLYPRIAERYRFASSLAEARDLLLNQRGEKSA